MVVGKKELPGKPVGSCWEAGVEEFEVKGLAELVNQNIRIVRNKCIASSNKCLTSSNKKLLETSATLLGTKGIATSNKCFV